MADEVATLVYGLVRAWDERMEVAVDGLRGELGVTLTARQALALWQLHEPIAMGDLALALGCDQSNVTGIVDRLERAGLVRREVDAGDRRVKRLVPTDEGQRIRRRLEGHLRVQPALAALPRRDLEVLRELLQRLLAVSASTAGAATRTD